MLCGEKATELAVSEDGAPSLSGIKPYRGSFHTSVCSQSVQQTSIGTGRLFNHRQLWESRSKPIFSRQIGNKTCAQYQIFATLENTSCSLFHPMMHIEYKMHTLHRSSSNTTHRVETRHSPSSGNRSSKLQPAIGNRPCRHADTPKVRNTFTAFLRMSPWPICGCPIDPPPPAPVPSEPRSPQVVYYPLAHPEASTRCYQGQPRFANHTGHEPLF
jgi:hypothetical protein